MQLPLQITFRHMSTSPAIEADIRERAAALERFFDRITGCRVAVEATTHSQRQGNMYRVRIDLTVPGRELVAERDTLAHHAYSDVLTAVQETFAAAQRQLEDYVRDMRGDVKTHAPPTLGRVARLFRDEGYGFILSNEGDEVYMHRNAVAGGRGFDGLEEGDEVRFVVHEGEGEKGPQASTVVPLGKRRLSG